MFKLFFVFLASSSLITSSVFAMNEKTDYEDDYNRCSFCESQAGSEGHEEEVQRPIITFDAITDRNAHKYTTLTSIKPGPNLTNEGLKKLVKLTSLNLKYAQNKYSLTTLSQLPKLKTIRLSRNSPQYYSPQELEVLENFGIKIKGDIQR